MFCGQNHSRVNSITWNNQFSGKLSNNINTYKRSEVKYIQFVKVNKKILLYHGTFKKQQQSNIYCFVKKYECYLVFKKCMKSESDFLLFRLTRLAHLTFQQLTKERKRRQDAANSLLASSGGSHSGKNGWRIRGHSSHLQARQWYGSSGICTT